MSEKEFNMLYWHGPSINMKQGMTETEFDTIVEIGKDMGLTVLPAMSEEEQKELMGLEENLSQILFCLDESKGNIRILTTIDRLTMEQIELVKAFFKRVNEHFESAKREHGK